MLTSRRAQSPLVLFLLQFHQPLIFIPLAAVLVTAILREWMDAGVIMGVVFVNASIGYIQESRARDAIDAFAGP